MIALKILSSKTKLDILELLNKRRYTITELSKHLNKSKSTISEHLTFLYNNGFVDKENNHKWTYYYISEKGKSFLEHIKALKMSSTFVNRLLKNKKVILSDINKELINSYNVVKNNPYELISNLENYKKQHSKEFYYKIENLIEKKTITTYQT